MSGGVLVITTPNAEYIEFGREKPGYLAVLTPRYHAVLYSPASIQMALRRIGFEEVQVIGRGATLLAVAGPGVSAVDVQQVFDPAIYRDYLEQRLASVKRCSILSVGLGYRLFKHLVNSGLYDEAEAVQKQLAGAVRERDHINILDPHRLTSQLAHRWKFEDFIERLPACLVGLLYFSAMLRLNRYEDREGALAYFYAAHVLAGVYRRHD